LLVRLSSARGSLGSRDHFIKLMVPRKVIWLALAGGLVSLLLLLPTNPQKPKPQTLDLYIASQPQITNGAVLISLVLSNGTSSSLNIVDDASGGPFVVLDDGTGRFGRIGIGLGILVNTLKLNLAPGASLMKSVTLTNPPPRFRLLVEATDLAKQLRTGILRWFEVLAVKVKLRKQLTPYDDPIMLPATPWIENGNIATTAQKAAEKLKSSCGPLPQFTSQVGDGSALLFRFAAHITNPAQLGP